MSRLMFIQEIAELERQVRDQTALSHDAERRAEHAELALIQAEQKLARVHESLDERDHLMQQQLDADHVRVCRVLVIFFFFIFILFFVFVVFLFLFIVLFSFLFFLFLFFFILFCFKNAVCAMYSIFSKQRVEFFDEIFWEPTLLSSSVKL